MSNTDQKTPTTLDNIKKASARLNTLYAPSVLAEAAALLDDMWTAGQRHGVTPSDWDADLADASLGVISQRYSRSPKPQRTVAEVNALHRALINALAELDLTTRDGRAVLVDRPGGTTLAVAIWADGGWDLSPYTAGGYAPVMPIAAPATEAGAGEVAAIVGDVIAGRRPDPFRGRS